MPTVRKTKRQVVSEFRRGEIVDAARAVFARKGFAATLVDDVAKEAGLAKGTLYLYFESKLEVYRAVLKEDVALLNERTLAKMRQADEVRKKIRAYIATRIEYCEERRDFFKLLLAETGKLTAPPGHTVREVRQWTRKPILLLAKSIEEAIAAGKLRKIDPESVAWSIADLTRGTIERRLLDDRSGEPMEDIDFIVDLVWEGIVKQ